MLRRSWFRGVFILLTALSAALPSVASEPLLVKVGGYSFPPFVDGYAGVTHDLIEAMNSFQSEYRFFFVATSAGRRYKDMSDGQFSHIFFESAAWGWENAHIESSRVYLRGDGEVFVALKKPGRDKSLFGRVHERSLLGVSGYHYGFANFEADQATLQRQFRISFANDGAALMRMLTKERGEVAVVTKSYLQSYLKKHPELQDKLLVSDQFDQHYNHTILVRKGTKPSAQEVDKLLDAMEKSGVLRKLWSRYGIGG